MTDTAIEILGASKSFERGKPIFKGIDLRIERGEMVALIGASGSGKSTLIRSICGLIPIDKPEAATEGRKSARGEITIFGETMQRNGRIMAASQRLRSHLGVVFQQFNLVPRLSLLTNVSLGLLGRIPRLRGALGWFSRDEKRLAMRALQRVGIDGHALKRGSELSGGQQQRAAIARTLVQGADIVIADEPIASLDPSSARRVMDILQDLNHEDGITVLVSLHQVEYALHYCPRTIALRDGDIVYDGPSRALSRDFLADLYGAESEELYLPSLEEATTESKKHKKKKNVGADGVPHTATVDIEGGAAIVRPN